MSEAGRNALAHRMRANRARNDRRSRALAEARYERGEINQAQLQAEIARIERKREAQRQAEATGGQAQDSGDDVPDTPPTPTPEDAAAACVQHVGV